MNEILEPTELIYLNNTWSVKNDPSPIQCTISHPSCLINCSNILDSSSLESEPQPLLDVLTAISTIASTAELDFASYEDVKALKKRDGFIHQYHTLIDQVSKYCLASGLSL